MPHEHPQSPKTTLENLFELKRRERPPEAFWDAFDARLREKQLAALIPVESPWVRWFAGAGRLAKFGIPVAAAVAVAVGVVSFNRQAEFGSAVTAGSSVDSQRDGASGAEVAEISGSRHEGDVKTVVIEVAPSVAEIAANSEPSAVVGAALNADQIARTLPWLSNVDFKRASNESGINLVQPLHIDRGPTAVAMSVFESIRQSNQPVWAPTEQNIREAVASEFGITTTRGDNAKRAWATRVIASNTASRFVGSRVESDYPREVTRVGVTGSTLSFKF